MKHLNERELSAMADGAIAGEALWRVERHLEGCPACRDALAALSGRDAALDAALAHDPGEAYFATFADRVVGRIAEAERAGEAEAPARGAAAERGDMLRAPIRLPWWQRPRALAMVGTAAVVVAGAGIVLMNVQQAELPLAGRAESPAARATTQAERSIPVPATEPLAAQSRDEATTPAAPAEPGSSARSGAAPPAAQEFAAPPASAPAPTAGAPAGGTRMQEVPRGGTGETRASRPPAASFAAPPRPSEEASPAVKLRELKRAALGPSGQKSESSEVALAREADDTRAAAPATAAAIDRAESAATTRPVCGVARDDSGRPLAGVTVTATGVGTSATTGSDGRFCLALPEGDHELQLLAVGFRPAHLTVTGEGAGSELAATLHPVPVLGGAGLARSGEASQGLDRSARAPTSLAPGGGAPPVAQASAVVAGLARGEAPFASLSDSLRALASDAARLQARAASAPGAAVYETAATAWERLVPAMPGGDSEVEVHARVAECRFGAWRRNPDSRRASRAVEALTRYVARAPAGSRRDLAARWVDQVRSR